ncbi:MAG: phosphohistidine phosphatase SixA [Candidatus Korobacteraceae bacterium]
MIVYFLRHVSAGQHKVLPKDDEKRPIDKRGEQQCHDVGRALGALGVEVDAIISSPLTRAVQTAELAVAELGYKDRIVISDAMRPEASYDQFHDLLTQYSKSKAIMVVGHNPSISEFLLHLVAGSDGCDCIDFKKGAVAKVEVQEQRGVLNWLLTPKMASKLQAVSANRSRPKTSRK